MKVVGYMRVNSIEQLGGTQVAEKEKSMVEKILDTERAGYAYFYPSDGGNRQEFFISTTPENMANFLGSHFYDAEKMIITDMVDRLILDTYGGFINTCPDQKLCAEIIPYLAPIQMGEKKKLADSYEQRLKDMDSFLEKQTCQIPEFDNDLVRRLIASIKVVSAEKLIIQFQSGIVMEQKIRYE